jgi:hypothetical protein
MQKNIDPSLTEQSLSRTQKYLLIVCTLLLHTGALVILFCMKTDTPKFQRFFQELITQTALEQKQQHALLKKLSPSEKIETAEQKQEEQEEWGAMKARASRFGAPVIFQEEPEFIIPEPPLSEPSGITDQSEQKPNTSAQESAAIKKIDTAEKISQQPSIPDKHSAADNKKAPSSVTNKDSLAKSDVKKENALFEKSSTQFVPVVPEETDKKSEKSSMAPTEKQTPPSHEQQEKNLQEETHQEIRALSASIAANKSAVTNPNTYDFGWGKKDAAPITKKMVSMTDLARGFLDNIKNEGTHAVTMIGGKEGGKVTTEQLKVERYVQRLNWCLQNSFRIHRNRYRQYHPATTAEVYLVLERTGRIKEVRILRSSGDPLLDDHTLFVFNDAGTAFPSVPQYLPQDPFAITYIVEYSQLEGPPQRAGFNIFS